jgi:hypothetical protein
MSASCRHPSASIRAWYARDDSAPNGQVLCIACCKCGAVLKGAGKS